VDRAAAGRIRATIEATLREQGSYPSYDEGLVLADMRFRAAIHELVQDTPGLAAEFDLLFPPIEVRPKRVGPPTGGPTEDAAGAKNARMHLAGMSGWLQGLIESPSEGVRESVEPG